VFSDRSTNSHFGEWIYVMKKTFFLNFDFRVFISWSITAVCLETDKTEGLALNLVVFKDT